MSHLSIFARLLLGDQLVGIKDVNSLQLLFLLQLLTGQVCINTFSA